MSLTKKTSDGATRFWCPGCESNHVISNLWQITGTPDSPTFSPSVLVTSGHYIPGWTGPECWCTFNANDPNPVSFKCGVCHSFVRDGMIQYLEDSTHALAGQTVNMVELQD